ncbi:hypothetical protein LCGC14_1834500 [marine sediment metagenome]|uniref:Uncharacterized protein n=1 Tax=marine sediment metagenome TaxID=412755 RepID=A0A0F9GF93_9ZZZZ
MKAEDIMDIIDDADCNADTCFVDSDGNQQPLGWTTKLIEVSFKAGIMEVVDWVMKYRSETTREFMGFTMSRVEWQANLKEWGLE